MGLKRRQVAKQRVKKTNTEKVTNNKNEIDDGKKVIQSFYNDEEISTNIFNFTSFKGITGRVPKKRNQNAPNLDNGCIEDLDYYHQLSLKVIAVLTFLTRIYKIDEPSHVCWDETHFGKFANHYMNGTFFFDVHPPLGKMLLAFAGWVSYYDGKFPFEKPGDSFENHNYVGMRMFCACLGGLCVPLVYMTVWKLTRSLAASILSASFVLFDTGCITISQYILLDPILMFFVMASVYSFVNFNSYWEQPYTTGWWIWMVSTGYFLGCTLSVKWVGLFVYLFIGVSTAQELWDMLGDLSISLKDFAKNIMARAMGLIMVPLLTYLFYFGLHFKHLPNVGPGIGFFSSAFQSSLVGSHLYNTKIPADLAYGSVITLKSHKPSAMLLHSHGGLYPKEHGPEQQQVTGYSHHDPNNNWIVHSADAQPNDSEPVNLVRDGSIIRLMHVNTKRNLHTHDQKAPISTHLRQVTAYGENGTGDENDRWKIKIVTYPGKDGVVQTVKTLFRLIHVNSGCALTEPSVSLPKWGSEQREIACDPTIKNLFTIWNIETNVHKQLPKVSIKSVAPSFLERVFESHAAMATENNNFKAKENEDPSRPWHWPINYKGQVFSGPDYRIYLLGNPVIWWLVLATYLIYIAYFFIFEVQSSRGCNLDPDIREKSQLVIGTCTWLSIGWALHYFPFFLMGRVLYFHHYFPSFLLSAMFAGILLEHVIKIISLQYPDKLKQNKIYFGAIGFILFLAVASFYVFRGLSYGMSGPNADKPNSTVAAYRWLDSWDV